MKCSSFKKESIFTIICILLYFLLVISANFLSNNVVKVPNSFNALFEILFPVGILIYLKKKGLLSYYGFNSLKKLNYKGLLFCIPMLVISFANLCFGVYLNYSVLQTILIVIAMIGVGFSEEILFRSFLINTISQKNKKMAILLPSIIFGALHLFNLVGGADLFATLLQVVYAFFFALMCSLFYIKTQNIIPCMICHALIDVTDTFMIPDQSVVLQCLGSVLFIIPSAFYAFYLWKTKKNLTVDRQ